MRRALLASALAATAVAAGCSGDRTPRDERSVRTEETQTSTTGAPARRIRFPRAPRISVPAAFRAEVYARGLTHPTAMAYGPDGQLYVTEDVGRVVVVSPRTTRPRVFASGFDVPLGLAWLRRTLYVSEQGGLERVRLRGGRAVGRRTVLTGLPYGLHQQDNVVVGPDGRLYLGSGSTCNACVERDRRSAAVLSLKPDGSGLRVVARGLRNPFGLAFQPGTDRLYATVNGRDDLPTPSSPEPAEMLVRIEPGAHYGWPRCWPSARRRRLAGRCRGVTRPVAYLEAHSSADGLTFATDSPFPPRFREGVFVALWGQYHSRAHGRRVDFVRLRADGTSPRDGVSPFADGFEHPLALAIDPHGALLVADYGRGVIYRIQARGSP